MIYPIKNISQTSSGKKRKQIVILFKRNGTSKHGNNFGKYKY